MARGRRRGHEIVRFRIPLTTTPNLLGRPTGGHITLRALPVRYNVLRSPAFGASVMSRPSASVPSLTRGSARPVRRRTRTFRPNYLSFAGTYQCNLTCPHCCVPIEWPDRLDIGVALRFLEDAHAYGI